MNAEDYLSAGRCPNCGQRLNVFGTYHHCYTCNSTWEHYQSMYGGTMTWGKVTGWNPPTEKEHFDHFEHYTS